METKINYTEAQEDLLWLSNRLKGIIALGPLLSEANSLENSISEKKSILNKLNEESVLTKVELQKVLDEVKKIEESNIILIAKANSEAQAILDKAKTERDNILAQAVIDAKKELTSIEALKPPLLTEIETLKVSIDALNHELGSRTQQLISVETRLQTIKETLSG